MAASAKSKEMASREEALGNLEDELQREEQRLAQLQRELNMRMVEVGCRSWAWCPKQKDPHWWCGP